MDIGSSLKQANKYISTNRNRIQSLFTFNLEFNNPKTGEYSGLRKELSQKIKEIAVHAGADLVGFAPAHKLEQSGPPKHKPSDLLPQAKSIIVLAGGNTLNEDRHYILEVGSLSTLTFIELKDNVKLERRRTRTCIHVVLTFLQSQGYRSIVETHGWSNNLSFKQASYFAGLGVFGKGNFIIHPKFGTINILACIVTDAEFEYDDPIKVDLCGDCVECIRACKYGTYRKKGEQYIWNSSQCRFYNTLRLDATTITTYGPCNGDCLNVCPIGKKEDSS